MKDCNVIGIDTAKNSFAIHVNNGRGVKVKQKSLKRGVFLNFFATCEKSIIALEACSASHHWGRELRKLGHEVRLIPIQHVIPFRKSCKNDFNDAEAIAEACVRPNMRFVAIKELWQQDIQCLHRIRQRHIKNQTSLVNEVRGVVAEYGLVVPEGISYVRAFLSQLTQDQGKNPISSAAVRLALVDLHAELLLHTDAIEAIDQQLLLFARENEDCKRIDAIDGIGPITATALVASCGDVTQFKSGRQFAARLGLVPGHSQTGGKNKKATMLGITKRGDAYLRSLLVQGSMSLIGNIRKQAKASENKARNLITSVKSPGKETDKIHQPPLIAQNPHRKRKKVTKIDTMQKISPHHAKRAWLKNLLEKKGAQKAAVAMANKNARIAWALMAHKTTYDPKKCAQKAA